MNEQKPNKFIIGSLVTFAVIGLVIYAVLKYMNAIEMDVTNVPPTVAAATTESAAKPAEEAAPAADTTESATKPAEDAADTTESATKPAEEAAPAADTTESAAKPAEEAAPAADTTESAAKPAEEAAPAAATTESAAKPAEEAAPAAAATDKLYTVENGNQVDADTYTGFKLVRNWCARCHGTFGQGMIGPNLAESLKSLTKDEFFHTVENGKEGQIGSMPSWKANKQVMAGRENIYRYLKARSDGAIGLVQPKKIKAAN